MSEDFKHIVRLAGTDLDGTKKIEFGLMKIKGIGYHMANAIVKVAKLDRDVRIGNLTDIEISKLDDVIKEPSKYGVPDWLLNRQKDPDKGTNFHVVGSDLALTNRADIEKMIKNRSWKGVRHTLGLKLRGQRTKTTGRKGRAVGIKRRRTRQ
jgi:small subunit ribosomal protein S13